MTQLSPKMCRQEVCSASQIAVSHAVCLSVYDLGASDLEGVSWLKNSYVYLLHRQFIFAVSSGKSYSYGCCIVGLGLDFILQ